MDRFSDAINTIKTCERIGRAECKLYSTKMIKEVLDIMQKSGYIKMYSEYSERYMKKLDVKLSNNINGIGVIKPRYAVSKDNLQKYEETYIPSKDFGILILSTPEGIMTNQEAKSKGIGGRLLAYVY